MRGRLVRPVKGKAPREVDRRGLAPSLSAANGRMPQETRREVTVSLALSFRTSRKMVRSLPTTFGHANLLWDRPKQTPVCTSFVARRRRYDGRAGAAAKNSRSGIEAPAGTYRPSVPTGDRPDA